MVSGMKTAEQHFNTTNQRTRRRGPMARLFRRFFVRDKNGAVAVEFGLLALPFFGIIGAILETALMLLASQVMDSAVENATRLIRTGQAQNQTPSAMTAGEFRTEICGYLFSLFDCNALKIRVTTINTFGSANLDSPVDEDTGDWTVSEDYDAGSGSEIVLVETYYKWPTIINLDMFDFSNTADGARLFAAVRVFRNEPF